MDYIGRMGWLGSLTSIGCLIGIVSGGILATHWGNKFPLKCTCATYLILFIMNFFLLHEPTRKKQQDNNEEKKTIFKTFQSIGKMWKNPKLTRLINARFLYVWSHFHRVLQSSLCMLQEVSLGIADNAVGEYARRYLTIRISFINQNQLLGNDSSRKGSHIDGIFHCNVHRSSILFSCIHFP